MKSISSFTVWLSVILFSVACSKDSKIIVVSVSNELPVDRSCETVLIQRSQLKDISREDFSRLWIKDKKGDEILVSQFIDYNTDGIQDAFAFQPVLQAGEERQYVLFVPGEDDAKPEPEITTFSRFVPERTDDYAWENDRVAFRTYGPAAQKMVEEGVPGGTLSSGIDCWLKKVEYPVIDRWYKKHTGGTGSYHEDTGEGLDNFHVGASRGCGGTGIWDPEKKHLYTSKNFSEWKTIAVGPLRTLFELTYDPWKANDLTIHEKKLISLDLGNNLSRFEVILSADGSPEQITAGLTLHENDGNVKMNPEKGWFSYWQLHGDSGLGMGIVVESPYLAGYREHIVEEAEMSHLFVHLRPVDGKVVYYAGFGWKENGRFLTEKDWISYLAGFSERLSSPLMVQINNN